MRHRISPVLFFLLLIFPVSFAFAIGEIKFDAFDEIKLYVDRDYVLNDTLEFAVFDMSEVEYIDESGEEKKIDLPAPAKPAPVKQPQPAPKTKTKASLNVPVPPPEKVSVPVNELRQSLDKLPMLFYKNLKVSVALQKVPLTLFSNRSPAYAKPLKLLVKIKEVTLKPYETAPDGTHIQHVSLRILGQLNDKLSDEVLVKFYDTAEGSFVAGNDSLLDAFHQITSQLMRDLALYLKTKY